MKKTAIILLHLGYWLMYLLLIYTFILVLSKNGHRSLPDLRYLLFSQPIKVLAMGPALLGFYSFYFFLFPFLQRKQFVRMVGLGFSFIILSGALPVGLMLLPDSPLRQNNGPGELAMMTGVLSLLAFVDGVIGLVMRGFISWYGDIRLKEELRRRNFDTELALVKSQLQPHFLFNTINNIDMLISIDAERASRYLNQLSDIMRFMLYEAKTEQIPLWKELDYINKYIALQRIRTANTSYVQYAVEGEAGDIMIAPMLFIPYIENAFKYAEQRKSEKAIRIQLKIEKDKVLFNCVNMYAPQQVPRNGHNGLGNELLQKRLALLYHGRHTLDVSHSEGIYKVNLILHTDADQMHYSRR